MSAVAETDVDVRPTEETPAGPPRARLAFWRSPDDQPRWARPALLAIAAVAAVLYAWNIRQSGFALFYSVAVKSMSVSWKAFFYGALDPGATITIDKLAGSFAPQALSARVFGYHAWSLTLPQVIEGVIAVLAMYRMVRRWFGPAAGLLAAGMLTATPVVASMFGHPMEDGMLTMCLVLAADAFTRAVFEGRLRPLVLAGVWVGIGFQAKMLQAWIILPALAITYLVAAPLPWRRRLAHLSAAGAVMLAVSLSWVMLYQLTPAQDRPYVDGSTNNSAIAMVFGYNGLERFGIHVPGSVAAMGSGGQRPTGSGFPGGGAAGGGFPGGTAGGGFPGGGFPGGAAGGGFPGAPTGQGGRNGQGLAGGGQGTTAQGGPAAAFGQSGRAGGFGNRDSWTKLLGTDYGAQIGWLYPLAALSLVLGLWWYRRAPRTDATRAGFLLWGLWLATFAVVFSRIQIPHTAYLSSMAPAIAALSAAGIVMFWRAFRDGTASWALPIAVVAEVAWTLSLSTQFSSFLPWLAPAVGVAAVLGLLGLGAAKLAPQLRDGSLATRAARVRRPALLVGLTLAVAAMLATPAAWAGSVLDVRYGGSAFDASAGPSGGVGAGARRTGTAALPDGMSDLPSNVQNQVRRAIAGGGRGMTSSDQLTAAQRTLDAYLIAHRDGATYVAAAQSWNSAAPYITATGQPFLPMGGFSGSVPQPTLAAVQHLVATGKLRFFLLGGGGFGGRDGGEGTVPAIANWVTSTCTEVPAEQYGGSSTSTGTDQGFGGGAETLYRCGGGS